MHISIPPELEARLCERAARTGKDVQTIVLETLQEKLSSSPVNPMTEARNASAEEWITRFEAWVDSHPPWGRFVDDSRESIYAGRGE